MKALLIINHQKGKKPADREPVKDTQISLARRNGSLIIESKTLLYLLEQYRLGTMTREEIMEMLKSQTGLLKIQG